MKFCTGYQSVEVAVNAVILLGIDPGKPGEHHLDIQVYRPTLQIVLYYQIISL